VDFNTERTKTFYRIELVDQGPEIGVEGQLINNGEMQYAAVSDSRDRPSVGSGSAERRRDGPIQPLNIERLRVTLPPPPLQTGNFNEMSPFISLWLRHRDGHMGFVEPHLLVVDVANRTDRLHRLNTFPACRNSAHRVALGRTRIRREHSDREAHKY
jgi:hypothetical protein